VAKATASPGLEWQERREAGFTEQRSLPASNGGRITGRCTMESVTDRRLAFGVLEFRSIWVWLEMAVGLTSHLFQRVPATDIFCQRNKLRVHIAPCFLAIHSLLCFHFTNFSLSLFYTEPWDEEFSSLVIHFVSFSCWCTFFFNC